MRPQESVDPIRPGDKQLNQRQDRIPNASELSVSLWNEMRTILFAQTAGDKSADKSASSTPSTISTEKYDKDRAAAAIKDLASGKYQIREEASQLLNKMGPQVIPQLKEALKSGDPEVRRRAEASIDFIERHATEAARESYLKKAKELVPDYAKLLVPAGASMNDQLMKVSDANGDISIIGPALVIGPPKGGVSKEMQKNFDELLKKLDGAGVDSEAFKKAYGELSTVVHNSTATEEQKKQYVQLTWLRRASEEGRQYYAAALSVSDQPEDRAKAVSLLNDHLNKNKGFKPNDNFALTFVRAGADKDPTALKRFKEHGGSDELLEAARETLKKNK